MVRGDHMNMADQTNTAAVQRLLDETPAMMDKLKAAYDTGDILVWCKAMAEDEAHIQAELGYAGTPIPMQRVVQEIEQLRELVAGYRMAWPEPMES